MSFCHHIMSCHLTPQCKLLKHLLFYKLLGLNSTKFGLNHPLHGYFQNCIWWYCRSSIMTAVTIYRTNWGVGLYIDPIKQNISTKWTEIWKVSPFYEFLPKHVTCWFLPKICKFTWCSQNKYYGCFESCQFRPHSAFFVSWRLNCSADDFRCLRYYCDNVSIS